MKTELLVKAIDKGIEALEHLKSALAKGDEAQDAAEAPLVSEADKLKGAKADKPKRTRKAAAPAKPVEPEPELEDEDEEELEEADEEAEELEDEEEELEDDAPKIDAVSLRTLLVTYAKKHSKEKAYKVLAKFAKSKKVNDVKPEDYQKLHDLLSK